MPYHTIPYPTYWQFSSVLVVIYLPSVLVVSVQFSSVQFSKWTSLGIILFLRSLYSKFSIWTSLGINIILFLRSLYSKFSSVLADGKASLDHHTIPTSFSSVQFSPPLIFKVHPLVQKCFCFRRPLDTPTQCTRNCKRRATTFSLGVHFFHLLAPPRGSISLVIGGCPNIFFLPKVTAASAMKNKESKKRKPCTMPIE